MATKKSNKRNIVRVTDALVPSSLILCSDVITASDGSVSYIRTIEQIAASQLPINPNPLWLAIEFGRVSNYSVQQILDARIRFKLSLSNPDGEAFVLGPHFEPNPQINGQDWAVFRLIFNFNGGVGFKSFGQYKFQILGSVGDAEPEVLLARLLSILKVTEAEMASAD